MRFSQFAALASVPCGVIAWGWEGHEIVGTIAQMYMDPAAVRNACQILGKPDCQLGPLGPWADTIKGDKTGRYNWAKDLHFANAKDDNPSEHCSFGEHGWTGEDGLNVLGAIRNTTDFLLDGRRGSDEALKFLIHFVGDLHQPLHLAGRERGGNDVPAYFDGKRKKFHGIWDTDLVRLAMDETPDEYRQKTGQDKIESVLKGKAYDHYIRKIVLEGLQGDWRDEIATWTSCPSTASPPSSQLVLQRRDQGPQDWDDTTVCPWAWASEIHAMNCDFVWPKELNGHHSFDDEESSLRRPRKSSGHWNGPVLHLDEDWYADKIIQNRVLDMLFAKAGVRLAAVLNHALA